MAVYSANSYRGKIPIFELSANADPKSQSSSAYSQEAKEYDQSYRDISWNLTGTRTTDSSGIGTQTRGWIGTQTRNSTGLAATPTVDYDVIIPWVLRNMLKSSTERGLESSRTGADRLKTLLESVELSRSGVFLVSELGPVLGELGIRVTLDILREMCRRYPANMADITEKYEWVEGMQKKEREKEKEKTNALKLRQGQGRGDKDHERSDLHHRADSKGVSKPRSASSSSKHSDSDDEHNYDDDDENGSEGRKSDSKSSAKGTAQSMRLVPNKMAPLVYSSLLIDKIDENTGLDVYRLIEDISSGRGLRPIVDSRGVDGENYDISGRSSYGILTGSTGGVGRSTTDCATLPSTLTVAMAVKARCAVINVCDSLGRSPLLVASALGNQGLLASLLSMGGDISTVTPDGHTAFTVAKSPRVRALPERSLLSWMNKREHLSTSTSRASADSTIRGRVERDRRKSLSRSDNLSSKTASDVVKGEGKGDIVPGNLDINFKSGEDSLVTSRSSDRGEDREGEREGDMLSQLNMMSVEERARAVAGLVGPLENLKIGKWAYSRPPLMWAVHNGLLSAVRGLLPSRSSSSSSSSSSGLSLGATSSQDPNCTDSLGRGSLHECAALVRSAREVLVLAAVPIAEALIAAGTDLNGASVSGRTALHELFCATQDEKVSSYRVSSDGTAAICVTATYAVDTQLVRRCRRKLVRSLLQFGADPLILDRHGLSSMHYCAREDHADCFLEMLLKGVDGTFLTGLKQTSLHIACKSGALKVAHLLCRWDADHVATPHRRPSILQLRDAQGKIPAQLLPRAASSKCLDTLWSACRAGNLSRY
jgi:ankyrin repeat protein